MKRKTNPSCKSCWVFPHNRSVSKSVYYLHATYTKFNQCFYQTHSDFYIWRLHFPGSFSNEFALWSVEALNTSTEIPCPHSEDDIPIRTTLTSFKDFEFMSMEVIEINSMRNTNMLYCIQVVALLMSILNNHFTKWENFIHFIKKYVLFKIYFKHAKHVLSC